MSFSTGHACLWKHSEQALPLGHYKHRSSDVPAMSSPCSPSFHPLSLLPATVSASVSQSLCIISGSAHLSFSLALWPCTLRCSISLCVCVSPPSNSYFWTIVPCHCFFWSFCFCVSLILSVAFYFLPLLISVSLFLCFYLSLSFSLVSPSLSVSFSPCFSPSSFPLCIPVLSLYLLCPWLCLCLYLTISLLESISPLFYALFCGAHRNWDSICCVTSHVSLSLNSPHSPWPFLIRSPSSV